MELRHIEADDAVLGQGVADHFGIGALRRQNPAKRLLLRRLNLRELFFAIWPAVIQ